MHYKIFLETYRDIKSIFKSHHVPWILEYTVEYVVILALLYQSFPQTTYFNQHSDFSFQGYMHNLRFNISSAKSIDKYTNYFEFR